MCYTDDFRAKTDWISCTGFYDGMVWRVFDHAKRWWSRFLLSLITMQALPGPHSCDCSQSPDSTNRAVHDELHIFIFFGAIHLNTTSSSCWHFLEGR